MTKLSLCMIVKNEEAFLKDCLEQAKPHCDEMIVVDTGSTDQTKIIARECGAQVYDFEWCDDFAKARNFSLEKANGEWILVLDADERMTKQDWQKINEAIQETDQDCFDLCQVNYSFETRLVGFQNNQFQIEGFSGYPGYTTSWLTRLFKNHADFSFEGVVHEHIYRHGKIVNGARLNCHLHHHGQALSEEKLKEKKQNYLRLGLKKVQESPNDFKAIHEVGIAYWDVNDLPNAEKYLTQAYQVNSRHEKNIIALASVLQLQGKLQKAEEIFQTLLGQNPQHASAHAGLGACLMQEKKYQDAIACFKKQIEINPELEQAREWLQKCYKALHEQDDQFPVSLSVCYIVKNEEDCLEKSLLSVKPHVQEIIVVDTGSTDKTVDIARRNGAKVFSAGWKDDFSWARNESLKHATMEWILVLDADEILSEQDWQDLRNLLKKPQAEHYFLTQTTYCDSATCLNWLPNDLPFKEAEGYKGYFESPLVRLMRNTPQIKFTGSVHEHAHHQNPQIQPLKTRIRIHHYGKYRAPERMEEKYELYRKIGLKKIEEMPEEPQAYFEIATQLMELGQPEEVEKYLKKSLELSPNFTNAIFAYANYLFEWGRLVESLEYFMKFLSLRPQDPQSYIYTASLLIELKKYDLALQMLTTAKELGGEKSVALLMNEGVIHLRLGDEVKAEQSFRQAYEINSNFSPVLQNLAIIEMKKKNFHEAERILQQALEIDAEDDAAYQKLGEVLFHLGEKEKSLQHFLKAHELSPQNVDYMAQVIINSHFLNNLELTKKFEEKIITEIKAGKPIEGLQKIFNLYQQRNDQEGLQRLLKIAESNAISIHLV